MFTQQNIKDTILKLEQKYPVDTWEVNGIDVWPYIRIKLYIHMLVLMNEKLLTEDKKAYEKDKKGNRFITYFRKIIFLLEAQLNLIFFYSKLKQKKLIFYGSHIHRVFQNGKYFNRFYDSMIDFHNIQNDVYTIEYQKIQKPNYNEKAIIPLNKYLDYYKFVKKIIYKLKQQKPKVSLELYNGFYAELSEYNLKFENLRLTQSELIKWSSKVNISKGFFEKLYKKIKPQKVIFLGYYGLDDLYAALIVANNFKIKTIDFQHGPQTNIHLAFSSWNKIPKNGFNTMPTEFWNWDEASKNNIDSWASKSTDVSAKVVGQPYLAYWLQKKQKKESKDNYIIYSLQTYPFTIKDMLTPKIVSLIKNLEYQWVLRLHPRNNLNINELESFIKANKIENKVIIQDAYTTPLPESITSSLLHITNYSGCLIEAYQLGVPTILINEVGNEMFSQYVDNKLAYYLNQNERDFELKVEDLINDLKTIDFKSSYLQVFNPLS
ncbi:hypothetical protein [Flavivirga spongiicola]|uniref:Uncharacterized protein n=1 Tax=Flavivirga spongiicola TaxID=421621 RepID=A0ABU7XNI5_9FLAO|nr:hypothetical protein [Flavivirga sp. MEBiC05379]MDO5981667.1 hypothetical protein [Flavivirga sp. MEBiC05379]